MLSLNGGIPINIEAELRRLLPKAIQWAEQEESHALKSGSPLSNEFVGVARRVGVTAPESTRIMTLDHLPWPSDPELSTVANQTGVLGPGMVGLTLGYAVFILAGHETIRLITHECRHVYQYESHGGISGFFPIYLSQIVQHGYHDAPMEIDARNHEVHFI